MAREAELTKRFWQLAPLPREQRLAVLRLKRELEAVDVFPPDETTTWFERDDGSQALAYVRRVPGRNLWIVFRPTGRKRLELLNLRSTPA